MGSAPDSVMLTVITGQLFKAVSTTNMNHLSYRLTETARRDCHGRVRPGKAQTVRVCFTGCGFHIARAPALWLRCEAAKTSGFKTRSSKGCCPGLGLVWRRNCCCPRSRLDKVYVVFQPPVSRWKLVHRVCMGSTVLHQGCIGLDQTNVFLEADKCIWIRIGFVLMLSSVVLGLTSFD